MTVQNFRPSFFWWAAAALLAHGLASAQPAPLSPGVMVVKDRYTGFERQYDLQPTAADGGTLAVWSTGDQVGADGLVRAVRMGNLVATTLKGALWKLPLQPGACGSATVALQGFSLEGNVIWKVVEQAGGQSTLRASVVYYDRPSTRGRRTGHWFAQYADGARLPGSYKLEIRGFGGPEMMEAAVKTRPG